MNVIKFPECDERSRKSDLDMILEFAKNWVKLNCEKLLRKDEQLEIDNSELANILKERINDIFWTWNSKYYPSIDKYFADQSISLNFNYIVDFYNFVQKNQNIKPQNKEQFFLYYLRRACIMILTYVQLWCGMCTEEEAFDEIKRYCYEDNIIPIERISRDTKLKMFDALQKFAKKWVSGLSLDMKEFCNVDKSNRYEIARAIDELVVRLYEKWDDTICRFRSNNVEFDFITPFFEYVDDLGDYELHVYKYLVVDDLFNIVLEYLYVWQGLINEERADTVSTDLFMGNKAVHSIPSSARILVQGPKVWPRG